MMLNQPAEALRMPHRHRLPVLLLCGSLLSIFLVAGMTGCGGQSEGPRRVAFSGSVTQAGQPVPNASIGLRPESGSHGLAANGSVVDGEFEIAAHQGPSPGDYVVSVQFILSKEELMRLQQSGDQPRTEWEFSLTIPDQDTFQHAFTLD
jgi:hypothetical protein